LINVSFFIRDLCRWEKGGKNIDGQSEASHAHRPAGQSFLRIFLVVDRDRDISDMLPSMLLMHCMYLTIIKIIQLQ